jgi:hypothetical protein
MLCFEANYRYCDARATSDDPKSSGPVSFRIVISCRKKGAGALEHRGPGRETNIAELEDALLRISLSKTRPFV